MQVHAADSYMTMNHSIHPWIRIQLTTVEIWCENGPSVSTYSVAHFALIEQTQV